MTGEEQARWSDEIACGVDEIDLAHQQFYDRLEALLACAGSCDEQAERTLFMEFLDRHLAHLDIEEGEMEAWGYADAPRQAHVADHSQLRAYVGRIRDELNGGGWDPGLVDVAGRLCANWLLRHTREHDIPYAAFRRQQRVSTRRP